MTTHTDDDRIDDIARGAFGEAPLSDNDAAPASAATPEATIDVADLLAYRAGELSPAETERVEAALADDAEARALLRELAQPVPPFLAAWGQRQTRATLGGRRRRWIAPAVTVALAAAVALFVFVPRGPSAPAYRIEAVRGVQAYVRGEATPVVGGRVDPDSVLVVALAPDGAERSAPPPARAFVEAIDGRLEAAPLDAIVAGEGGALRFEAAVADLFGRDAAAFGARTVWIAVGADPAALAALDGRPAETARDASVGVRWLPVRVDYREAPR